MNRRGFIAAVAATMTTRADAAVPGTPQAFGAVADGVTDSTEALQKMLDAGGEIRWPTGRYLTRRLALRSRSRIIFDPGVVIVGAPGEAGVLRAPEAEDVHLEGQGATILGPRGNTSHTVNLAGARRVTLRGLTIVGGDGAGEDALYIGRSKEPSQDIRVDGCVIRDAKRNCISVTSCFGFTIENCDIHGAVTSPGAGIDLEANRHGQIGRGVIRNNRVHDNGRFGILIAFGDDVQIHRNEVFGNGRTGIAVGAGAAQWNENVYRPGIEFLPISRLDPSTGEIEVGDVSNIEVGAIVSWRRREGREPPSEFARQGRYVVLDRNLARQTLILSADGVTPITRLSPPGRLRLGRDMDQADLALRVYAEGQASNVDIYANRCHGNGAQREIDVSASVRVQVRENEIDAGADRTAVHAAYARRLSVIGNRMRGSRASTSIISRGLHVGLSSYVEHGGNQIEDFGYAGLNIGGVAGSYTDRGDTITNCGWLPGGAPRRVKNVSS